MRDLLVLWEWEYDLPFVARMSTAAAALGLSFLAAGPAEVAAVRACLWAGEPAPRVVVDRASDVLAEARAIALMAVSEGSLVINDPARVPDAADKRTMHLALMSAGVHVPWTILLPPGGAGGDDALAALPLVGTPFVIKPAHGGGGDGVVLSASTLDEILRARETRAEDSYLVQERIAPVILDGRRAWFRVLFCRGDVTPCFWDHATGSYAQLDEAQAASPWAARLGDTTRAIAAVSGMDLFSTELAMCEGSRLVAVDYVNDMCDLRPASLHPDGVPDVVVAAVIGRLVGEAAGRAGIARAGGRGA